MIGILWNSGLHSADANGEPTVRPLEINRETRVCIVGTFNQRAVVSSVTSLLSDPLVSRTELKEYTYVKPQSCDRLVWG